MVEEPKQDIMKMRHSMSHILAQAVKHIYPDTKLGIGPATDEGFYYDLDPAQPFTPEDLKKIEKEMDKLVRLNQTFEKKMVSKADALKLFKDEPYKIELIKELEEGTISTYTNTDFTDLCKGPHVENTKCLKNFKLLKTAGAYWKGKSENKMLQRIYGVVFHTDEELKAYLAMLAEAEKRNHRKIGEEMELFAQFDLVGKGLPVWLPKGFIIKNEIEKFAFETEEQAGYVRVTTPHLAKQELFMKSGHLPHYKESMYPSMTMDDGTYYLKAMNCPMHHLVYGKKPHSYRELPIRIAEYGTCYRNELSGTLNGLLRVRMLSMNDAHIYCRKDQIEHEVGATLSMIKMYFETFGIKTASFRLSLWDPSNKDKYIDEPENWKYAEEVLRKILVKLKLPFVEARNEAAFYGPKIDIQLKNVYGREETMSTVQLDFAAKKRFELSYMDETGKENPDVFVIHRAPLSTHERFMAFIIEHFAGKFPLWLSPVQVVVLPVGDAHIDYADTIGAQMKAAGIRVEVDKRNESISKKVREAQKAKINYMVVVGDKEVADGTVTVRTRDNVVHDPKKAERFISEIVDEIKTKAIQ